MTALLFPNGIWGAAPKPPFFNLDTDGFRSYLENANGLNSNNQVVFGIIW
jgi:hypothetical protein